MVSTRARRARRLSPGGSPRRSRAAPIGEASRGKPSPVSTPWPRLAHCVGLARMVSTRRVDFAAFPGTGQGGRQGRGEELSEEASPPRRLRRAALRLSTSRGWRASSSDARNPRGAARGTDSPRCRASLDLSRALSTLIAARDADRPARPRGGRDEPSLALSQWVLPRDIAPCGPPQPGISLVSLLQNRVEPVEPVVKTPLKTSTFAQKSRYGCGSASTPPALGCALSSSRAGVAPIREQPEVWTAWLDGLDGLSFEPSTFRAINSGALDGLDGLDGLLSLLIIERSQRGGRGSAADPLGRCGG